MGVVAPTDAQSPFEVTVTGTRDGIERSIVIGATAIPGSDDLGGIAAVFLDELGGSVPGPPADRTATRGRAVSAGGDLGVRSRRPG